VSKQHVVETEVRVRYAETDAQGMVYYSNYFVWFEVGRMAYLREIGLEYADLEQEGIGFVIADASCKYLSPAHFDEVLTIRTWVEDVKEKSFGFSYEIVNKETGNLLAKGRTVQVFINLRSGKAISIPPRVNALLRR
jgi:acyl-CoA thioester hydrolase